MRDPFLAPLVGFGSVRFAPSPKLRLRPSDFAQDDTLKYAVGKSVTKLIHTNKVYPNQAATRPKPPILSF